MIWDFQAQLARRLLLWGIISAGVGLWLLCEQAKILQGIGLQAVLWGVIEIIIALFSLRRAGKRLHQRVDLAEVAREKKLMRRLLLINMALDLLYIAGGTVLLALRGSQDDFAAGSGWGIIIQGAFLIIFDLLHAWGVPDEYTIPDLGILEGEEHSPSTQEGGKGVALLVHGFPGTPAELRSLADALHRTGWTVRQMRLPGHGSAYRSLLQTRAPEWERAVLEELAVLQVMHRPVLLVGYSLGASLSIPVAAERNPDGLVLLAPFWIDERWWFKILLFMLRSFLPISLNPFMKMKVNLLQFKLAIQDIIPDFDFNAARIQAAMRDFRMPVIFVEQFLLVSRWVRRSARHLRNMPVLVIQAMDDQIVHRSATQKLVHWMGASVSYREVPGDHNLNQPAHPGYAAMEQAVLDFADHYLAGDGFKIAFEGEDRKRTA